VVDKTGTLTYGDMEIYQVDTYDGVSEKEVLAIAASIESHANHPIARAFQHYHDPNISVTNVENSIGAGLQGMYHSKQVKIGSYEYVLGDGSDSEANTVYLSLSNQHIASFKYRDPIREQAAEFISKFKHQGVEVTLLTGDTNESALSVANEVGIDNVIAKARPQDKLNFLNQLDKNQISLMIGDGINDAPILAGAHLSVAMGSGTDVAKASADMTLLGDRLDRILQARTLALQTKKIIYQNLAWSLGYNLLILPLAVSGYVAPYVAVIGMSASSIIVVSNSLRLLNYDEGK
jgi:Cu2+-exporting ATPase